MGTKRTGGTLFGHAASSLDPDEDQWAKMKAKKARNATHKQRRTKNQAVFLKALAECGIVGKACQIAGVTRHAELRWRNSDQEYAAAFHEAMQDFFDKCVAKVVERAFFGERSFKFNRRGGTLRSPVDGKPYYENRYSDKLVIPLLNYFQTGGFGPRGSGQQSADEEKPGITAEQEGADNEALKEFFGTWQQKDEERKQRMGR